MHATALEVLHTQLQPGHSVLDVGSVRFLLHALQPIEAFNVWINRLLDSCNGVPQSHGYYCLCFCKRSCFCKSSVVILKEQDYHVCSHA